MNSGPIEPVTASVRVEAARERTFGVFVGELGRWWPLPYTCSGAEFATARIEAGEGGRWYECDINGLETEWGTVRVFEPPQRIVLAWTIGLYWRPEPPDCASEVEIAFAGEDSNRTRIDVEHRDFDRHGGDAGQLRDMLARGWPIALTSYRRFLDGLSGVALDR